MLHKNNRSHLSRFLLYLHIKGHLIPSELTGIKFYYKAASNHPYVAKQICKHAMLQATLKTVNLIYKQSKGYNPTDKRVLNLLA